MLSLAWRVSHVMLSAASRRRIISPGTPASARRFRAMHPAFSDAAIGRLHTATLPLSRTRLASYRVAGADRNAERVLLRLADSPGFPYGEGLYLCVRRDGRVTLGSLARNAHYRMRPAAVRHGLVLGSGLGAAAAQVIVGDAAVPGGRYPEVRIESRVAIGPRGTGQLISS